MEEQDSVGSSHTGTLPLPSHTPNFQALQELAHPSSAYLLSRLADCPRVP